MDEIQDRHRDSWLVPGAIIVAGIILALATYAIRSKEVALPTGGDVSLVRPIGEDDHIIGNPGAPVVIIEYADIDSGYTKSFQATMQQLMAEYAAGGKVAWVYRHLPLLDQFPNSRRHAEAAECVASIGGEPLFWRFIDAVHARAPSTNQLDPSEYPGIVEGLGLRAETVTDCLTDSTFAERVMDDFENGVQSGADGSPFAVILIKGRPPVTIDGAVPYEAMKRIIEESIRKAGA
ncbi:MAG TPA: thioredoxin domain-containing protein [Candidatus Paceibacterota bacterium]|jgi:protein-disulfide isomerase